MSQLLLLTQSIVGYLKRITNAVGDASNDTLRHDERVSNNLVGKVLTGLRLFHLPLYHCYMTQMELQNAADTRYEFASVGSEPCQPIKFQEQ